MNESVLAKRQFYSQTGIASHYDEQRFGGASGAWVNQREIDLVLSLLPSSPRVLDLACGTGRLTRALAQNSRAFGLDAARAMLDEARHIDPTDFIQGDAFKLPFADSAFDAVTALRLVFHFKQLDLLFAEVSRVVRPGGSFVFDTYLWSPRAWRPLDPNSWGGSVFIHSPVELAQSAQNAGLVVAAQECSFLFSPYIYRRLPLPIVQVLARVETRVPANLRARVFWRLVRR